MSIKEYKVKIPLTVIEPFNMEKMRKKDNIALFGQPYADIKTFIKTISTNENHENQIKEIKLMG